MSVENAMFQFSWEEMLAMTGWALGVAGVAVSTYYGKKSLRLERERITLKWDDIQIAADDLTRRIKESKFAPSLILTLGSKSAYLAHLMSEGLPSTPPVIVGVTQLKGTAIVEPMKSMLTFLETTRWQIGIPTRLLAQSDNQILIVDDWVLSGDAILKIREQLEAAGINPANIKSATVVATEVAVHNKKGPDFYWKITASTNFYFPWGRAL